MLNRHTAALCAVAVLRFAILPVAALLASSPAEARPRDPLAELVAGIGKAFAPPAKAKRHGVRRPAPVPVERAGKFAREPEASVLAVTVHPLSTAEAPRANASGLRVLPDTGALRDLVAIYAARHGIEPRVALALIAVESNFDPWATGGAGEVGLGQIKPATARDLGYAGSVRDLYAVGANLHFAMKYLAEARRLSDGTLCGMLSLYNAGIYSGARRPDYCRRVKAAMQ